MTDKADRRAMEATRRAMTAFLFVLITFAPHAASETPDEPGAESHGHATHGPNEIGVLIGITAGGVDEEGGKESSTGTIGLEYRRRLSRLVGVGILFEYAGGVRRDHVGIVPVTFMLGSHAQLIAGAGWERSYGTEVFAGGYEFVGRLGFGYSIGLVPGNTIRPEINVDFVDNEELVVVGASIGWGF